MASGDEPVSLGLVPEDTRARYISKAESGYLVRVFPKKNLFEREDLER